MLHRNSEEGDPDGKAFEEEHRRDHAGLAAMLRNGKLVIARHSGHHVQLDEPELVISRFVRCWRECGGDSIGKQFPRGLTTQHAPMLIRAEEQRDWTAVHAVNVSAFDTVTEANLVDALREHAQPLVSLVAEDNGEIVGHIMFSPVSLSGHPALRIMGLAPMAVSPERQRKGIGSALVSAGLEQCKQLGFGAVVVLGHPAYYPRFGFSPSVRFGIGCEYEVPEEVFMVMELRPGFLRGASGKVKYHAAFSEV